MNKLIIDLVTKYPLFNSIFDNNLNIYVFGNNVDFVDCALQLGQIEDVNLSIFWECDNKTKEAYLKNRPSLDKFVSIDGKLIDNFGELYFKPIKDVEKNGYCVSDKLNSDRLFEINNSNYRFIIDNDIISLDDNKIDRFFSNEDEIERMAYNINTIWYNKTKYSSYVLNKQFSDKYNHNSSIICAISMQYKLIMANILEDDYDRASKEFLRLKDNGSEYDKLVFTLALYEHRRWCIEKLVSGWNPLENINDYNFYSYFVSNKTLKNKDMKIHPAIARMHDKGLLEIDKSEWGKVIIDNLDDLDKVSLNIHNLMGVDSKKVDKNEIYDLLFSISKKIDGELYSRYELIVQNIMDGIDEKEEKLAIITKKIKQNYKDINEIDEVNDLLFSSIEFNKFRNFKKNNIDIIENIPFILSYRPKLNLGNFIYKITNRYEDSNNIFSDVASAITIYPKKVYSVIFIEDDLDVKYLTHRLESIDNFYRLRDLDVELNYLMLLDNSKNIGCLKEVLKNNKNITYENYQNVDNSIDIIFNYFKNNNVNIIDSSYLPYDKNKDNFNLMKKISSDFPYFEFDNMNQEFTEANNCWYLILLKKDNYLTIDEIFMLNNAKTNEDNNPNFISDYQFYWDIFTGKSIGLNDFSSSSHLWNVFCEIGRNPQGFTINQVNSRRNPNLMKIINYLERENRVINTDGIYFFINDRDRKLLEKAGDLLEFYVFYELLKSNYFSDVKTGYKFIWGETGIDNELDAVLTSGYKSVLIECKVIKIMDQNFYLKLDSIADHFGVNFHTIIVAISETLEGKDNLYKRRGDNLDIITLSSLDDLNNIADRIKEIIG